MESRNTIEDRDRIYCGKCQLEKRADEAQYPNVVGYASVFYDGSAGTEFWLMDDMVEHIMPGAFNRALAEKHNVRALWNHNPDNVLASVTSGKLKLSIDQKGLRYEIDMPEVQLGKYLTVMIGDEVVTQSSFGFEVLDDDYRSEERDGRAIVVREIKDVRLWDVSPVTFPAYEGTSALLSSRSKVAVAEARSRFGLAAPRMNAVKLRERELQLLRLKSNMT